ncbi:MAG: flagellar brake domain-containing protein [Bacillota bacterium]|nr:flagellar brake domain-containing protein [Bacillota bacterium]
MLKNLTVNKLLEVEVEGSSSRKVYKSRIEEINSEGIWIANPIERGNLVMLSVGETVKISYGDDICVYIFPATIKKRVNDPLPMLLLEQPDSDKVIRVQRRDFVRINVVMPLKFGITSGRFDDLAEVELHEAKTIDISGGGLKLLTKVQIKEHNLLKINLSLSGEMLILYGKAVRVSAMSEEHLQGLYAVGVQFINIPESDRDKIIKFVFDWQRQMRRKGLL